MGTHLDTHGTADGGESKGEQANDDGQRLRGIQPHVSASKLVTISRTLSSPLRDCTVGNDESNNDDDAVYDSDDDDCHDY